MGGSKRAAWAALVMFVDLNQDSWDPDPPDVGQAEQAMHAIAAHEVDEAWTAAWLRERVSFVGLDLVTYRRADSRVCGPAGWRVFDDEGHTSLMTRRLREIVAELVDQTTTETTG